MKKNPKLRKVSLNITLSQLKLSNQKKSKLKCCQIRLNLDGVKDKTAGKEVKLSAFNSLWKMPGLNIKIMELKVNQKKEKNPK